MVFEQEFFLINYVLVDYFFIFYIINKLLCDKNNDFKLLILLQYELKNDAADNDIDGTESILGDIGSANITDNKNKKSRKRVKPNPPIIPIPINNKGNKTKPVKNYYKSKKKVTFNTDIDDDDEIKIESDDDSNSLLTPIASTSRICKTKKKPTVNDEDSLLVLKVPNKRERLLDRTHAMKERQAEK